VIQAGFVPFAFGGLYYFHRGTIAAYITLNRSAVIIAILVAFGTMFLSELFRATVGPFFGIPVMWLLLSLSRDRSPTGVV